MTATRTALRSSRPTSDPAPLRSRRQRSNSRRSSVPTQSPQSQSRQNTGNLAPLFPPSSPKPHPLQPNPFQPHPRQQAPHSRSLPGHRRKTRRFYYLSLMSEAGLKIVVNGLLLSAFAVALGRLLPQMWQTNQQRLAIETELEVTQQRVHTLEQHFSQTFDPRGAMSLIEQQSYQVDPQKQRIVFVDKLPEEQGE